LTGLFAESDLEDVLGGSRSPLDPAEMAGRARVDRPQVSGVFDGSVVRAAIARLLGGDSADQVTRALVENAFSDENLKANFHRLLDGGVTADLSPRANGGPQVVVRATGLGSAHGVSAGTSDFRFVGVDGVANQSVSVARKQVFLEPRAVRIPIPFVQIVGKIAGLINSRDSSFASAVRRSGQTQVVEAGVPVARAGHTVFFEVSVHRPGRWLWSRRSTQVDVVHVPVELAWPVPKAVVALPEAEAGGREPLGRVEEIVHAEISSVAEGVREAVERALRKRLKVNDPAARDLREWLNGLSDRAPELFGGQVVRKSFPSDRQASGQVQSRGAGGFGSRRFAGARGRRCGDAVDAGANGGGPGVGGRCCRG
jgi:hypothetical protein